LGGRKRGKKSLLSDLIKILDKGHIGLMFDYDPDAKKKTSGVLIISNVDKGLKEIAEQL